MSEDQAKDLVSKVTEVLDEIRPKLQADGGDLEFVEIQDGVVSVKLKGACGSCPFAMQTLKHGVERLLKERVPEVQSVKAVQ